MRIQIFFSAFLSLVAVSGLWAADPTATSYPSDDCQGSYKPYPVPRHAYDYPDSLEPVMINHVGRHGSRFPSSSREALTLMDALERADSLGTITPAGRKLMALTRYLLRSADGQWGALDSLGMAEQRGIASRMYARYPELFNGRRVRALSSYSPRCAMSMYAFVHQLARLDNDMEISTSSGRGNSALMRPFDTDKEYLAYRESGKTDSVYAELFRAGVPTSGLRRVLGEQYPYGDEDETKALAYLEYRVVAGMNASGIACDLSQFFTEREANALWSAGNLNHYLNWSSTTLSTIPSDMASALVSDLVSTTDAVVDGKSEERVVLRFGHGETLMPLLALLRVDGGYYMTNYFDTVALHWRDFQVSPMSSNLQMILFKSKTGRYYVRMDLNEVPVSLVPDGKNIYMPWDEASDYMMRCVPLYYSSVPNSLTAPVEGVKSR